MEDLVLDQVCHCGRRLDRGLPGQRRQRGGQVDRRSLCATCAREADRILGALAPYAAGLSDLLEPVKLVFLDFDGVMASGRYAEEHPGEPLEPAKVALLDALIARTGALVVVASSWRTTVGEMRSWLGRAGLRNAAHRVLSITPRIEPGYALDRREQRAAEIALWLAGWGFDDDSARFCILDDGEDMGDLAPHHVMIDPFFGLTPADTARAARLLGFAGN